MAIRTMFFERPVAASTRPTGSASTAESTCTRVPIGEGGGEGSIRVHACAAYECLTGSLLLCAHCPYIVCVRVVLSKFLSTTTTMALLLIRARIVTVVVGGLPAWRGTLPIVAGAAYDRARDYHRRSWPLFRSAKIGCSFVRDVSDSPSRRKHQTWPSHGYTLVECVPN